MSKRISALLIALVIFVMSCSTTAFAAESKIRGVKVNLPDVYAEIAGSYNAGDIEEATLAGEKLTVKDAYKASSVKSKVVYLLVDISTSMNQKSLDALKGDLINYANSLGKDDKFVMMTFGKTVTTVLSGGESKKEVKNAINDLKCNSNGTTFYKAIEKAYNASLKENDYVRKYAIVVSDGADYEKGNSSQEEVIEKIKHHELPVYGMCEGSSSKSSADGFGYIARTSGATLVKFSAQNASKRFDGLKGKINDVTVVELQANSKKSLGSELLKIKLDKKIYEQEVSVKAAADNDAPDIDKIEYDKDENAFKITFTEEVEKADSVGSYTVKTKSGSDVIIAAVKYNDKVATLKAEKKLYTGEYTFSFKNITDASDNKNALKNSEKTEKVEATPFIFKILIYVGIALIPILFLVCIYILLISIKKKKNVEKIKDIFVEQVNEREVEHVVIQQPKGQLIKISIDAGNGQYHTVDYNLVSSMIIGRSDMCDLKVDDEKMSKQHFVVEQTEGGLAITDLETTNGTYVSGVRISSRTLVRSGVKVMAGNSIITFYY